MVFMSSDNTGNYMCNFTMEHRRQLWNDDKQLIFPDHVHILKEPARNKDARMQIVLETELTEGHPLPKKPKMIRVRFCYILLASGKVVLNGSPVVKDSPEDFNALP